MGEELLFITLGTDGSRGNMYSLIGTDTRPGIFSYVVNDLFLNVSCLNICVYEISEDGAFDLIGGERRPARKDCVDITPPAPFTRIDNIQAATQILHRALENRVAHEELKEHHRPDFCAIIKLATTTDVVTIAVFEVSNKQVSKVSLANSISLEEPRNRQEQQTHEVSLSDALIRPSWSKIVDSLSKDCNYAQRITLLTIDSLCDEKTGELIFEFFEQIRRGEAVVRTEPVKEMLCPKGGDGFGTDMLKSNYLSTPRLSPSTRSIVSVKSNLSSEASEENIYEIREAIAAEADTMLEDLYEKVWQASA